MAAGSSWEGRGDGADFLTRSSLRRGAVQSQAEVAEVVVQGQSRAAGTGRSVPTYQAFGHVCDPHCVVWCCSRAPHLGQAPFTSAGRHFVAPAAILRSCEAALALSCYPPTPLGGHGEEVSVVLMAQTCSLALGSCPGCLHAAGLRQAASCSHCGVSASFPALHHSGLCSMSSWHLLGMQGPRLRTPCREAGLSCWVGVL